MQEIRQQGPYHYVFSRYVEPVATVQPGETVAIYTDDAFESRITRAGRRALARSSAPTSTRRPGRSTSRAPSRATRWPSRSSASSRPATGRSASSSPTSAG